jgi:CheY-like chemotaxis protein
MPTEVKRIEVSVLVVDDDEPILKCMPRLFHRLPVQLRLARSGAEALAQIEADQPDLLVTDLHMPGAIDGLALIEQVRERWPQVMNVLQTSDLRAIAPAERKGVFALLKLDAGDALVALVTGILARKKG